MNGEPFNGGGNLWWSSLQMVLIWTM